jgi:hypothetical protein|nr:MAG TPA: hypothetical protein [Caudoviricetes sp.]
MNIDYNDQRFKQVESEKQSALDNANNTYNTMINNSDKYYQDQIQASKDYATKQQEIQQANTDFAIEKIEQQKEQTEKDYTKEQKGAYADYQKQTNDYGVNAEQMASSGLSNSGYSESSKVSMYNTYQNRVAIARDSFDRSILNYNNGIKDAQLQNNSALAEIAYNALQKQLELGLQGFQYKNSLLESQLNTQQTIENTYQNKWQAVLDQMNKDREFQESVRQYNESLAFQKQQEANSQARWNAQYGSSSNYELTDGSGSSGSSYGYFSNGYQPKGIDGYGAVSKTGKTIMVTNTKTGNVNTQNVWKTPDGTQWYWEGGSRTYKKYNGKSKVV